MSGTTLDAEPSMANLDVEVSRAGHVAVLWSPKSHIPVSACVNA
jgi:hypothetical protein